MVCKEGGCNCRYIKYFGYLLINVNCPRNHTAAMIASTGVIALPCFG